MDVQKDFADLCSLLNEQGVEFLIVGGYAVGYHGAPRFTGDLDILVRPDGQQIAMMLDRSLGSDSRRKTSPSITFWRNKRFCNSVDSHLRCK